MCRQHDQQIRIVHNNPRAQRLMKYFCIRAVIFTETEQDINYNYYGSRYGWFVTQHTISHYHHHRLWFTYRLYIGSFDMVDIYHLLIPSGRDWRAFNLIATWVLCRGLHTCVYVDILHFIFPHLPFFYHFRFSFISICLWKPFHLRYTMEILSIHCSTL